MRHPHGTGISRGLEANLSASGDGETKVYRRPWRPMVILAIVFVGIGIAVTIANPAPGLTVLAVMGGLSGFLLWWNARSRVVTSDEGVTVVPFLGRSKHYPWSDVVMFSVQRVQGGRYGGPIVSMSITGRSVLLQPTMMRDGKHDFVQRTADALNADLARQRRPAG
jgi:hypothetical protein